MILQAGIESSVCRELKVETQNINVRACRFYARLGCELRVVRAGAYPQFPEEVQLLWYKTLTPAMIGDSSDED